MKTDKIIIGEFYNSTDGVLLQVRALARDKDTGRQKVVCQIMREPFECVIWDINDFEKETKKCDFFKSTQHATDKISRGVSDNKSSAPSAEADIDSGVIKEALLAGQAEQKLAGKVDDSVIAEKGFMEFLDADSYSEKYQLFLGLRNYLDRRLLGNIAAALDIVLEDGSTQEQYDTILDWLQTYDRYECNRLR